MPYKQIVRHGVRLSMPASLFSISISFRQRLQLVSDNNIMKNAFSIRSDNIEDVVEDDNNNCNNSNCCNNDNDNCRLTDASLASPLSSAAHLKFLYLVLGS